MFSRENKVQTFFFRVHWLSEIFSISTGAGFLPSTVRKRGVEFALERRVQVSRAAGQDGTGENPQKRGLGGFWGAEFLDRIYIYASPPPRAHLLRYKVGFLFIIK